MLKLFISYSHADAGYVKQFLTCLSQFPEDFLDVWYDRNIKAGDEFWDEIDKHLANRDVVCLLLSRDYIASKSCREEMRRAMLMHHELGTLILPVILRPCAWKDQGDVSKLLATTTDGKEIQKYDTEDDAWQDVYEHIEVSLSQYSNLKELVFEDDFQKELDDATILSKAHSMKNELKLSDIFIYPDLTILDYKENDKSINSEAIINDFTIGNRIAIIGDDQSGKSALLKKYVSILKDRLFLPIYIKDPQELLQGNLEYRIENLFKAQYKGDFKLEDFDKDRIVPIVDDFHKANKKERILEKLSSYKNCIITVDDIFSLDVKQGFLITDYKRYKIKELKPSQRTELIRNWLCIREIPQDTTKFTNEEWARLDEMVRMIDASLGKAMGAGIMPAYPYFILFLLSTYETGERPVDQSITSQGYCYQALIYVFLRKYGVSNDDMDTYVNFLTEFAYKIYLCKRTEISADEYEGFVNEYDNEFNLTVKKTELLSVLSHSNIINISSLNNYSFAYPYLYYFFAGRYFAQMWDDPQAKASKRAIEEVNLILDNLHKSENAYIAIFIAHHTKSSSLIDAVMKRANGLFASYVPASLDQDSLAVFNNQKFEIPLPTLPHISSPEQNRKRALALKDEQEEKLKERIDKDDENEDEFSIEFRRAIKTVEVVGTIIKNRAGSLSQENLCSLFQSAMDIHLRQLTSFFGIVDQIISSDKASENLYLLIKKRFPNLSDEELEEKANGIFWALNFAVIIGFIKKTAFSLGSVKLSKIAQKVCDERNTPASFMLKHTILMWYKKSLQMNEMEKIDVKLKSPVAKRAMLWLITDYVMMHRIDYKDRGKLLSLGIKEEKLLPNSNKS